MGILEELRLISTHRSLFSEDDNVITIPPSPLLGLAVENGTGFYVPTIEAGHNSNFDVIQPFDLWWNEKIYGGALSGLSRKEIISSMRDQDGGGHVDDVLTNPAYIALVKDALPGMLANGEPLGNAQNPMVRQIAWELEIALDQLLGPLA